ncbi:endolytic transglycosylase MltG [Acidocella sp. MX-AZ03]|uniref:endolytic transglycosylase MltG n=1 Tax=Acidocella sp. MX-AZ03 TaxID=2697363 RepID=UPI0022DDAC60|nr:endolytic transglycosylase MltG [Acidocella sp. MX-AZ03]WBO58733.1 endolytic transglycosylase MltG [Acidocella sp. MX-AZ03]
MAVHESYDGPGAGRSDLILMVPPGGTQQVASTLAKAGVIDYKLIFRAAAWFTRGQGPLRTGEYLFPQHASLHQILDILRHGAEVQHQATIPEGLTGSQIADILNALPVATGHVAPPAEGRCCRRPMIMSMTRHAIPFWPGPRRRCRASSPACGRGATLPCRWTVRPRR